MSLVAESEGAASMEESIGAQKKNKPLVPENYVSILDLKERWLKEKERKQKEKEEKEEEERRRKLNVEEQKRREKLEAERQLKGFSHGVRRRNPDGKGFGGRDRRFPGQIYRGKERLDGGEAISGEAEETVAAAIVIENGETAAGSSEIKRKRKSSKKKKKKRNQAPIEGNVTGFEPNAPPENSRTENIRGKNPPLENAPTDSKTPIEARFEALTINGGEERGDAANLRPIARLNRRNDYERQPRRAMHGREPMRGSMVWVKKGEIHENCGGGSAQ